QNIDMNPLDYVIAMGSLLLVSFWTLWLPRRGRLIALVVLDILLTALIYSDMVYYRYFQDFITIPVLLQAGQVDSLGGSIASLMYWWDIFFFADWILFIPYVIFVASLRRRLTTND
ncbi:LTA synthase family protein, partial [Paenibacillus sp. EKM208P]